MSKLGKKPIHLPKDTTIKVDGGKLILTGPKGSKELNINDKIFSTTVSKENNLILTQVDKNAVKWCFTKCSLHLVPYKYNHTYKLPNLLMLRASTH